MTIVPRCIALKTPSRPSSTCSTSGESGTIVMIRVACFATSAGDLGARRAGGDEVVDRPPAAAVRDHRIAGLQQVLRHRPAHETQADESNRLWHAGQYSCVLNPNSQRLSLDQLPMGPGYVATDVWELGVGSSIQLGVTDVRGLHPGHREEGTARGVRAGDPAQRTRVGGARRGVPAIRCEPGGRRSRRCGSITRSTTGPRRTRRIASRRTSSAYQEVEQRAVIDKRVITGCREAHHRVPAEPRDAVASRIAPEALSPGSACRV